MFEYRPNNVFSFAYFFLLVASLFKIWDGFDIESFNVFDGLFSESAQEFVTYIIQFLVISFCLYVFSSYIFLENSTSKNVLFEFSPNILMLLIARFIRLILITLLSVKIFLPTSANSILLFLITISSLLITEQILRCQTIEVIRRSGGWANAKIKFFPFTDVYCLFLSFCSIILINATSGPYLFIKLITMVALFLFLIVCFVCSLIRLIYSWGTLKDMAVCLTERPKVHTPRTR